MEDKNGIYLMPAVGDDATQIAELIDHVIATLSGICSRNNEAAAGVPLEIIRSWNMRLLLIFTHHLLDQWIKMDMDFVNAVVKKGKDD